MVDAHCYALYRGPKRDRQSRWVPAVVTKVFGTGTVSAHVVSQGPIWRRHIAQLRPQYRINEGADLGEIPSSLATPDKIPTAVDTF